jgi:Zn-dependent peptidase ImmA (M78 family)
VAPNFQHITVAYCCETAEEVRNRYWQSQAMPVDIDHIIEYGVGLTIIPLDGLRNDLDIYGFLSNDRSTIFVDSGMMISQKFEAALRFTMAHELGHYFLHREFYEAHKITTSREWQMLLGQIDGANLMS